MKGLMIIDVQNDFLPGGALAVPNGDDILDGILSILPEYDVIGYSEDQHKRGHVSFASSHAGKKPGDIITLYGHPQMLHPDHCVEDTFGALTHKSLPIHLADFVIRKGKKLLIDSYSPFYENWSPTPNGGAERRATGALDFFLGRMVKQLTIVGLARDFCVKWGAEDAGMVIPTRVIWDLTRAVFPESDDKTIADLRRKNVMIV
jgi:nicotinamidase/pyrazinamidase